MEDGLLKRGVVIRHLLLPGALEFHTTGTGRGSASASKMAGT